MGKKFSSFFCRRNQKNYLIHHSWEFVFHDIIRQNEEICFSLRNAHNPVEDSR